MNRTFHTLSLFAVTAFSVIIFSSFVAAGAVTQPIPLRVMYLKSDLVFIGTVSRAGEWQPIAQDDGRIAYRRSLMLTVETPIKGMAPGEIAVSEIRIAGKTNGEFAAPNRNFLDSAQRRLFFLGQQDNSYYLLSNFHGDLPLNASELDVYAARLRELQNIYLSGHRIDEQITDWLAGMAADPVTRFDGAYDLGYLLGIAHSPSTESGTSLDPSGKPEGSAIDPNGRGDDGVGIDPHGRSSTTEESDAGSRLDPNGRSVSENRDQGGATDPDGKSCSAKGDQGSSTDPDGRAKGDQGSMIDPDGRRPNKGARSRESGSGIDPDGKSSAQIEAGTCIDPNGKSACLAKGDQGGGTDPDGKGLGVDPNGRGALIDPDGKSSVFAKSDDGRGIDPNGRGGTLDPFGRGAAMDPNGKAGDETDAGPKMDPNGKTGDDKDAGPRIDPEGRRLNSLKSTGSREAGVIIDPNGRGGQIDPNGKTGDDKDAGPRIDPNGRGAGLDPNGNSDAGIRIDDNGRSAGIDPNGRDSGTSLDPNGRDSGTSIDPSGRSLSAVNREKLIQAFLAVNYNGASLSESDLALLSVVSTFHDSRVNAVLAAHVSLLTAHSANSGRAVTSVLDAAARSFGDERLAKLARLYALTFPADGGQNLKGGVDEWDGDILKRNAAAPKSGPAVDEWDSDVVKVRRSASIAAEPRDQKRVDEWDSEVVKRDAVDQWDSDVVKRGGVTRAELLRLINARMLLLVRGQ